MTVSVALIIPRFLVVSKPVDILPGVLVFLKSILYVSFGFILNILK